MNIIKKDKGITIVILVITVIVLLIIAGITITGLGKDAGILGKGRVIVNDWKNSEIEEEDFLNQIR